MMLFLTGLILFFGPHLYSAFRSREDGKDRRKNMGEGPYKAVYSVISLAGFVLIVMGFGAMRPSAILYTPPTWGAHVNRLFMMFALVMLVASQLPAGYIKKKLKHPMLTAVKIWALGHLLSNGELNSVILFGAFLAYAVISRIRAKRRGDMGAANADARPIWDAVAIFVGLALYGAFMMGLHIVLFGVSII